MIYFMHSTCNCTSEFMLKKFSEILVILPFARPLMQPFYYVPDLFFRDFVQADASWAVLSQQAPVAKVAAMRIASKKLRKADG